MTFAVRPRPARPVAFARPHRPGRLPIGCSCPRVPALALLAALLFPIFPASATAAPRPAPKLVVILVVDQFRADYVDKFSPNWTGGLRRLVDQGAWFRQAAYPYAGTVTCAGHSTIVTGSLPATHGIIGNSWWDRDAGRTVPCVSDPDASYVSYGKPVRGGSSTRNLLVPALPDELRAQMKTAPRIVTLSLKDYTATTLAGRRADAATWFNAASGSWLTSSAFTNAPVPFIAEFIKAHPVEADFGKTWEKMLPASAYRYEDDGVGEKGPETWGRTFPHPLKGKSGQPDEAFYDEWTSSPWADAYLGKMAEWSVDALKLGQGAGTDYLAVSFSTLDEVGHAFGPRSHEVQDVLARLDKTIGALIAHLDRRLPRHDYVLALTGDHGVSPIPEQMRPLGVTAGRVVTPDVTARVEKVLEPALGAGKHVARMGSDLYFAPGDWRKIAANADLLHAVLDTIRATPGVARVLVGEQLASVDANADDRFERAAKWSYFPGRSGDLIIMQRPYWLGAGDATTATGTGHGSAYSYDQRVPLFLFGQGIKRGEYLAAAGPMDIAPTLAYLCGITLPAADGRVLDEALAPSGQRTADSRQQTARVGGRR